MDLLERVSLHYFDTDGDGKLSSEEARERQRVLELNNLSLAEFLTLSPEDRQAAEELWTARVIDANLRRQQERLERTDRQFQKFRPPSFG